MPARSFANWRSSETYITYTFADGAGHASVRLDPVDNSIGRAQAIEARAPEAECQSVDVEFLSGQETDGTSNPVLAPDLPNLGCYYGPISARLQEQGSILLSIEVLADGAVGLVRDVGSSIGKTRLMDQAVEIAQTVLRFRPAIRDGRPVAVVRRVSIDFRITKPIRGTP